MEAPPLSNARRVVVLWIGRLGDLLVATPFLDGLRRAAPRAEILLVTGEAAEAGARLLDSVDDVRVVRRGKRLLANITLIPAIRRQADLLVDLNPSRSKSSAALAVLASAKVKAAFKRGRRDVAFSLLAERAGDREHMLSRYQRMAAVLGFEPGPSMRLPVRGAQRAEAAKALSALPAGRRPVALFPGNFKKRENRWPEDRFAALAGRLAADAALAPYWLAGPGELDLVQATAAMTAAVLPVLGPYSIGVTAALLEASALYMGNCTGTSHMAVCVGTPSFTVLAGYTATVWAPPGTPGPGNPHWRAVSASWDSCRDVGVDDAWAALQPALDYVKNKP